MKITNLNVHIDDAGKKFVDVCATFEGAETIEPTDVATLLDILSSNGASVPSASPEEEQPKQRRRRRTKKEMEEARAAEAAQEPEEEEEEAPRRRRRSQPSGPTLGDVQKMVAKLAEVIDGDFAADLVGEFSTNGKVDGIEKAMYQDFLDAAQSELDAPA